MSEEKPKTFVPLVDLRIHNLVTIRKKLKLEITEAIQRLRDDAQQARERTEHQPKIQSVSLDFFNFSRVRSCRSMRETSALVRTLSRIFL